jgi:hypothetical protein
MTELSEVDFLRNAVSELEEEGYEVFIQPQPPILPSFLKDFRPDAIARRNGKNLVIEVVKTLEGRDKALAALASSIRARPGWEMRVIVVNPATRTTTLTKQSIDAVQRSLDEVSKLIESGHYRAALLMAWSTFEAAARDRSYQGGCRGLRDYLEELDRDTARSSIEHWPRRRALRQGPLRLTLRSGGQ